MWGGWQDLGCAMRPPCPTPSGALYDPASRRWRPAPTCGYPNELLRVERALWTGSEAVVVSGDPVAVAWLQGI